MSASQTINSDGNITRFYYMQANSEGAMNNQQEYIQYRYDTITQGRLLKANCTIRTFHLNTKIFTTSNNINTKQGSAFCEQLVSMNKIYFFKKICVISEHLYRIKPSAV